MILKKKIKVWEERSRQNQYQQENNIDLSGTYFKNQDQQEQEKILKVNDSFVSLQERNKFETPSRKEMKKLQKDLKVRFLYGPEPFEMFY
jgi:hypothetical protein